MSSDIHTFTLSGLYNTCITLKTFKVPHSLRQSVRHSGGRNTLAQSMMTRNSGRLDMAGTSPHAAEATADGADGDQMLQTPSPGVLQTPPPGARAFFNIVKKHRPQSRVGWGMVAAELRRYAAEFNKDAANHDAPKMCHGALQCTGEQLQRRWNSLLTKRKPTGNPSKPSDVA